MAHIRFHSQKRVHTRLSEKDRTQRLTRRNTGYPLPRSQRGLCCQRNPFYSTVLLYTYISRFTVNLHYQQREKSGETTSINFIPNRFSSQFSTSPTTGPRSLSRVKAGTHSTLREKSHTTAHAETGGLPFCEHRAAFYCQRDRSKQNDQKKRMHA